MDLIFPFLLQDYLLTFNTKTMTNSVIKNIRALSEIMKSECEERSYKDINLTVFNDGIHYVADKLFMCFNSLKKGYYIILRTDKGTLVSADFNSIQAESEFLFLSRHDSAAKQGIPTLINFFNYTFYCKSGKEMVDKKKN